MILPSKHLPENRALLSVGAAILRHLLRPVTVSALWEEMLLDRAEMSTPPPLRYDAFVLALDLLFLMGVVELHDGLLLRTLS